MDMIVQQKTDDIQISVIVFGVIVLFYLYYYFAHSVFLKNYVEKITPKPLRILSLFFIRKLSGFLLLGVIPGILYYFFVDNSFEKFGMSRSMFQSNILIILLLTGIIVSILFVARKTRKQGNSLQLDIKEWTLLLFSFNTIGWIVYLVGYEFLFRGILLFECSASFGFWPAIAINVVLYSAIHMVNGKEQATGALVFGTVACYFTLTAGTILIPIFMHISLSIFSDYFSIRFNNELSFIKSKKANLP
jgi:membrane protease YdiL (CAAX protease family)